MARTATAASAARAPGLLRAALLLLLLVAACRQAAGETPPWAPQEEKGGDGWWAPMGGIPLTEPVVPANRASCPRSSARGQRTALPVLGELG